MKKANYFLTKAQREFLIEEYMDQLEEFDQLDEYGYMEEKLKSMGNAEFYTHIVEFMPIFEDARFIPNI